MSMRTALMEMVNNQLDEAKRNTLKDSDKVIDVGRGTGQLDITHHIKKKLGISGKGMDNVYFDDTSLVYGDETVVRGALANKRMMVGDLVKKVEKFISKNGRNAAPGKDRVLSSTKAGAFTIGMIDNKRIVIDVSKADAKIIKKELDTPKSKISVKGNKLYVDFKAPTDLAVFKHKLASIRSTNESVERKAWVPESISDEQVEAFMEAALAAVQEGKDTFVFEAKHYKAKTKKEDKLDPVGKEDDDVDNDGDVDSSDKYLKKRRAAIKKSMDEAEEMDPTKHVSKKGDMYCVYNKDGEEVAKFDNEEEANAYARKNHDALMGKEEMDEAAAPGSTAQHGATKETSDTFEKQIGGGRSPREKEFVDMHKTEVGLDVEKVTAQNKQSMEDALKQTPPRMGDQKTGDTSFVNPVKAEIIDGITKALQQMKTNS